MLSFMSKRLITPHKEQPAKRKPLIFVHVPKTAGTSFYHLIEKNYAPKNRFVFNTNKGKNPLPKLLKRLKKDDIQIVYGHGTFGLHEALPGAKYVSFVRHPVSHTISNYHYIRTSPHNRLHQKVKEMSFSEFVSNLKPMHHDNLHYRQLTHSMFKVEHPQFMPGTIVPNYRQLEYGLKSIDMIFRFDDLDQAIDRIATEFNWTERRLAHKNVSKKIELKITQKDIDQILEVNHLDLEIYKQVDSLQTAIIRSV